MDESAERLAKEVPEMDREELVHVLRACHCDFELDFAEEFLETISLDRLRHITLAALLHTHGAVPTRGGRRAG